MCVEEGKGVEGGGWVHVCNLNSLSVFIKLHLIHEHVDLWHGKWVLKILPLSAQMLST